MSGPSLLPVNESLDQQCSFLKPGSKVKTGLTIGTFRVIYSIIYQL